MARERRCGNCGARHEEGWQITCRRLPPPWEPVDPHKGWCFIWVPERAAGEDRGATEAAGDAVAGEL